MSEQVTEKTQLYVALRRIGGDGEVWLPGSLIALTDAKAAILMAKGVVAAHVETTPPAIEEAVIVVHEPVVAVG
jgi:hypothetical protein